MSRNIAQIGVVLTSFFLLLPPGLVLAQPQDAQFQNCDIWCRGTSECVACSSLSDCGAYYTDINDFKNGKQWYACRPRSSAAGDRSEDNRRSCISYCTSHSERCDMCAAESNCGPNYRRMASFTSRRSGRSWYACEDDTLNRGESGPRQGKIEYGTISIPEW